MFLLATTELPLSSTGIQITMNSWHFMSEIARLRVVEIVLSKDFVEQGAKPEAAMKLGIRLHQTHLSLLNITILLVRYGVDRCRSTAHN